MEYQGVITERHSVRKFKPDKISDENMWAILNAGRRAPSAKNMQNWRFVFVQNPELIAELSKVCQKDEMVAGAPALLVTWATEDKMMACGQSTASVNCTVATTFMMLKATDLGIGSCWLGAYDPEEVKKILGLPETATVVSILLLGCEEGDWNVRSVRKTVEEISDIRN